MHAGSRDAGALEPLARMRFMPLAWAADRCLDECAGNERAPEAVPHNSRFPFEPNP